MWCGGQVSTVLGKSIAMAVICGHLRQVARYAMQCNAKCKCVKLFLTYQWGMLRAMHRQYLSMKLHLYMCLKIYRYSILPEMMQFFSHMYIEST